MFTEFSHSFVRFLVVFGFNVSAVDIRCWDEDVTDELNSDVKGCYIYIKQPTFLTTTDKVKFIPSPSQNLTEVKLVKWIKLSDFGALTLPPELFTTFPALEILQFPANLNSVSKDDFINANNLTQLKLSNNHLKELKTGVFSRADKLSNLELDYNDISVIEDFAFENLINLEQLKLSNNFLTKINRLTLRGLPSLKVLNLRNNLIETFEDGALDFPNLRGLFIADNNIKIFPDSIFTQLPNVFSLDAKRNELRRVNNALYLLQNLEFLELDYNTIEDLDINKLASMPKLVSVSLRDSGFNLDSVSLSSSDISVSDSKVSYIDLSENKMENGVIFDKLKIFPKLDTVSLEYNRFSILDLDAIRTEGLPKLRKIMITGSNLKRDWLIRTTQSLAMSIEENIHGLAINCLINYSTT